MKKSPCSMAKSSIAIAGLVSASPVTFLNRNCLRLLLVLVTNGLAQMGFPQGPPALGLRFTDGTAQISLTGATGTLCQVQCLAGEIGRSNQWSCVTNLALTASPQWVVDSPSAGTITRFYRAMAVAPELAPVPGGSFAMGDTFGDLGADEVPVHTASVSAFYMDATEVSKALWEIVYSWATNNGYSFAAHPYSGKAPTHPVQMVNWFDAAKWCNARSQMEGLTPCYYTNDEHSGLYSAGQITLSNSFVNWSANGYRLPTEAEWERAARGGFTGRRFPWADTNVISHSRANYRSSTGYSYDISPTRGFHPAFTNSPAPYTSPTGYFAANAFGLHDMAGNVWEWCWDFYDAHWYTNAAALQLDTHGPNGGSTRVARGGSWESSAPDNCCAIREGMRPTSAVSERGFRCVRGSLSPSN